MNMIENRLEREQRLMEIRKLECEMAELDRMLDNVGDKLNSVDHFIIPEI